MIIIEKLTFIVIIKLTKYGNVTLKLEKATVSSPPRRSELRNHFPFLGARQ